MHRSPLLRAAGNARTRGMPEQCEDRIVDVGGVPILLEAEDACRANAVAVLLAGLAPSERAPAATIRYVRDPPPLPRRDPDQVYDDMRIWRGDELFLQYASDVRARVTDREAHVGGGSEHLEISFARLFHPAVTHILAGHDRFVLHAAAFADRGIAFLALGATGSGKSTLSLSALHAGWQLLADDLVVLRQGAHSVEVAGIARRTALPGDVRSHVLGECRPLLDDDRGRWELPPHRLARGWFPLAGVVLPAHGSGARGELRRSNPMSVFERALGSFTSVADATRGRRFLPCAAAVARLAGFELRLAADPTIRIEEAATLLEDVAGAARGPAHGGAGGDGAKRTGARPCAPAAPG